MGKKDTLTKDYMKNAQVFADAFNHLIYQGKKKINPEMLHTVDTTALSVLYGKDEKRKIPYPVQKYRDELKLLHTMEDGQAVYVLLGVENQSEVHYAMPVKDMVYDALEYVSQIDETARKHRREGTKGTVGEYLSGFYKDDILIPVVTLVIYFGADEWDGPRRLHEMFEVTDEKLLSMVPDYKINLIVPAEMNDEDFEHFTTDLREVLLFLKYLRDKKKLQEIIENNPGFHEMETKTVMMLKEVTNVNLNVDERKEKQNMRTAIDDIREEAELLGEARGETKGQKSLIDRALRNGKSEQEIAAFFNMPLEEMQKLQEANETE